MDLKQFTINPNSPEHKEEKMLKNANEVLKPEEEFDQYSFLKLGMIKNWKPIQRGVYIRQGVKNNNCFTIVDNNIYLIKNGDCNIMKNDQLNTITR